MRVCQAAYDILNIKQVSAHEKLLSVLRHKQGEYSMTRSVLAATCAGMLMIALAGDRRSL